MDMAKYSIRFLGIRSAKCPANRATAINGTASASPTSPSTSGSCVRRYKAYPTTTSCASKPNVNKKLEPT